MHASQQPHSGDLHSKSRELSPGQVLTTKLSQIFSRSSSEKMWREVLEVIHATIPCQVLSIWSLNPKTGLLSCIQALNAEQTTLDTLQIPVDTILSGQASNQQEPLCITDLARQHDNTLKIMTDRFGTALQSALFLPLQVNGMLVGAFMLLDQKIGRFSAHEIHLLEPVQGMLALGLKTAALNRLAQQQEAGRERAEEALLVSQQYARNIIESSLDMIIAVDNDRKIIEFNSAAQKVFGYTPHEVLGKHISMLYADTEDPMPVYHHTVGKGAFFDEILNKRKNGEVFPCLLSASILYDARQTPIGLMGISRDITERKRAEQLREALYRISEATQMSHHLEELYPALRDIIGGLMPVENFYIAFYDAETETIRYPYYVDDNQVVARSPRTLGHGLADYVLRTGQPLLLTPEILKTLVDRGEMKPVAFTPTLIDWLGVPLKSDTTVTGILAVQSHSETTRLGEEEKQLLMFVSSQIAVAIARKQAEEDRYKLEKAIETTEIGITITDTNGRIMYLNPANAAMHGYHVGELIGQSATIFTLPHLRNQEQPQPADDLLHRKREGVSVRKDESIFPVKLISNPIATKEGELIGYVTICEDISERKKAEKLLRESEQRYRSIVENATTGIFQATLDGRFITANPALARMLGYASARELMETVTNIAEHLYVNPHHWHEMAEIIRVTREPTSVETCIRHRDGGEIVAHLNIWAISRETGDRASAEEPYYFEGFVENITERKQMEKTLVRQAALLRSVANAMTSLLVNPNFQTAMTQALEVLGYATEVDRIILCENHPGLDTDHMVMKPRFQWVKETNSGQVEAARLAEIPYHPNFTRWYDTLQAKRPVFGIVRNFSPAEREVLETQQIMSLIVVPVIIREQFWGILSFHDCHTERTWREEEESILLAMAASIGGAIARQQAETELITANSDLTEALETLQRTQTQLIQSEKMAALGQLVAGVAHEINTPLAAIRSAIGDISTTLQQTLESLPDFLLNLSPECRKALFTLIARAEHKDQHLLPREERKLKERAMAELEELGVENTRKIGEMLVNIGVYERFQAFRPIFTAQEPYTILEKAYRLSGLRESAQTISTAVERASKVVFALKTYAHFDQSGEMSKCDVTEGLETVLTLYHNKLKHNIEVHRRYEPIPPVKCYPNELDQVWINLIHNALQAMDNRGTLTIHTATCEQHVLVAITDTGTGIPEDVQPHIFDPFFTTKPQGEGSGLGLDIVRKIVEKHHGDIQVQSVPGKTTFSVYLPL